MLAKSYLLLLLQHIKKCSLFIISKSCSDPPFNSRRSLTPTMKVFRKTATILCIMNNDRICNNRFTNHKIKFFFNSPQTNFILKLKGQSKDSRKSVSFLYNLLQKCEIYLTLAIFNVRGYSQSTSAVRGWGIDRLQKPDRFERWGLCLKKRTLIQISLI